VLDAIGWLTALAGLGVLFHYDFGKSDRRFKTGFKNNVVPTQIPVGRRLKWTGGLWLVAALCLSSATVLRPALVTAAFAASAFATWQLYPHFWSRYQRGATSAAAFLAARATMCVVVGGIGGYFASQAAGSFLQTSTPGSSTRITSSPSAAHSSSVGASTAPIDRVAPLSPKAPGSDMSNADIQAISTPDSVAIPQNSAPKEVRARAVLDQDATDEIDARDGQVNNNSRFESAVEELRSDTPAIARPNASLPPVRAPIGQQPRTYANGSTPFAGVQVERGIVVPRRSEPPSPPPQRSFIQPIRPGPQGDGP
jgi:hypothetical protein